MIDEFELQTRSWSQGVSYLWLHLNVVVAVGAPSILIKRLNGTEGPC